MSEVQEARGRGNSLSALRRASLMGRRPLVQAAARARHVVERPGRQDRDVAVLAEIEQVLISTDEIICRPLDDALQIAVVGRVVADDV